MPQPSCPRRVSEYALACLRALAENGLGHKLSLGGGLGLAHYYEYRPTYDVDAWWAPEATEEDRQRAIAVVYGALRFFGTVRMRAWGDLISVELQQEGQTIFSFQVNQRSALLAPGQPAPWVDVLLDSLQDLVACKMVALVERGAPRDFRDIYTLCHAGVAAPAWCWALWREWRQRADCDTRAARATLALQTHLARIAVHRPLEEIADPAERAAAEWVRTWFATEFLDGLVD